MTIEAVLPVEPFLGQDFYVPAYRIRIQGQELLEETYDITTVSYSEGLDKVDSFDLTVNNWDAVSQTFKYSDAQTFRPWSPVEVSMGYILAGQDGRRLMLTGEITTMAPNYPAAGGPTLTVRGLNLLHRFRLAQDTQTFFNKTDTEIAAFLVGRIAEQIRQQFRHLKLELDPLDVARNKETEKERHRFLVMQNQYPIMFLMERARRIGYELTIKEMPPPREREGRIILGYGPTSAVTRATYLLEWGKTLISAQPTLRVAEQVSQVTVRGWLPGRKKPITETAKRADLAGEGVVDPRELDLAEPAIAEEISVDRPIESASEAKTLAKQILKQKASELVVVKAKTIGLPDLRAGSKVQLLGLGTRFSGPEREPFLFLVTETTHAFGDSGYTTDFTARMESGK